MSTTQIHPAEIATTFVGGFDEEGFSALNTAGEPLLLRAKREEGFAVYRGMPTPTSFDEEWRRTDPGLFSFDGLSLLPVLPQVKPGAPGPWDDEFDVVVSVRDEGYSIDDRTGVRGDVTVLPLAEAARARPELTREYFGGRALPASWGKFVALNQAFWNFGLLIHIADGLVLEKGILIRYAHTTSRTVLVPRLVVVAGEQSRATVMEELSSPDDIAFLTVPARELYIGAAARLRMISLQEWGRNSLQIGNDMAMVGRDAQVDWITLNFGTRVSKLKFGSDVEGEGSSAELDGLFYCDRDQHIDQKTLQIHSAPHTYSRLLYKGVVQDRGHSVYQGIIQARPGAVKVDAYQTNNNLVLSDGATVDTIPGLLIDADDLKCSHGATIGNLDPDQVFYLRARGLTEREARRLLIRGFYDEIADRIPYPGVKERIHEIIDAKLGV